MRYVLGILALLVVMGCLVGGRDESDAAPEWNGLWLTTTGTIAAEFNSPNWVLKNTTASPFKYLYGAVESVSVDTGFYMVGKDTVQRSVYRVTVKSTKAEKKLADGTPVPYTLTDGQVDFNGPGLAIFTITNAITEPTKKHYSLNFASETLSKK